MCTPGLILSPEHVKGKRGDARRDVYSLGSCIREAARQGAVNRPNPLVIMNERWVNNTIPPRGSIPKFTPNARIITLCLGARSEQADPTPRNLRWIWSTRKRSGWPSGPTSRLEEKRSPDRGKSLFYIMLALIQWCLRPDAVHIAPEIAVFSSNRHSCLCGFCFATDDRQQNDDPKTRPTAKSAVLLLGFLRTFSVST